MSGTSGLWEDMSEADIDFLARLDGIRTVDNIEDLRREAEWQEPDRFWSKLYEAGDTEDAALS